MRFGNKLTQGESQLGAKLTRRFQRLGNKYSKSGAADANLEAGFKADVGAARDQKGFDITHANRRTATRRYQSHG